MPDKWRAAWTLLDEDKTVPEVYRCHARCWLTYKAIDGMVNHDELMNRVLPVRSGGLEKDHYSYVRWLTSQAAASFYYFTLKDMQAEALKESLVFQPSHLISNASTTINYLRVMCIRCHDAYLTGKIGEARSIIESTLCAWKTAHEALDWKEHPMRFTDLRSDSSALHTMMIIAEKIGMLNNSLSSIHVPEMSQDWHWVKCIKHLHRKNGSIPP
jgi:hypothetical protein